MTHASIAPAVLVILDGWGHREAEDGNAIRTAHTPIMDSLWEAYPHTLIHTSGKKVGLPEGQMGNSEVGHLNLGAGRIVPQELVRITDAVEDGSFLENPALVKLCETLRERDGRLHCMGLCSEGGVHSHLMHLFGLLDLAKAKGLSEVCLHVITDGRDTKTTEGIQVVDAIAARIEQVGLGKIVTVSGRYYAMDRDRRWDRVQKAYDVMVGNGEVDERSPHQLLQDYYDQEITDEFIPPTRVAEDAIAAGDGIVFFNFRPDRARQLTAAFIKPGFEAFEREQITPLEFVTFTQYDASLDVQVAFEPQSLHNILGEVIANQDLRQFRTAETEKYPHVTYFFNGGLEQPFPGEDRELIPSPQVATYDRQPEMSAQAVTQTAAAAIAKGVYSLIVMNYANPDMVGHTGNMDAAMEAITAVDTCIGQLVDAVMQAGGTMLITADHGNAEYMWDEQHRPWTAHTTNRVPLILVEGEKLKIPGYGTDVQLREGGRLCDIAPTLLEILQLEQPPEMTGRSLLEPVGFEVRAGRSPVKVAL
ncbi:MAG: 2,3-bisphosphoglycerate-independent phosphoglycerate mutase [Spirulinaceae cyanobacterium]